MLPTYHAISRIVAGCDPVGVLTEVYSERGSPPPPGRTGEGDLPKVLHRMNRLFTDPTDKGKKAVNVSG